MEVSREMWLTGILGVSLTIMIIICIIVLVSIGIWAIKKFFNTPIKEEETKEMKEYIDIDLISDYIIELYKNKYPIRVLAVFRLMKLLYYAQGISLAIYHKPIFKENIYPSLSSIVIDEVYDRACRKYAVSNCERMQTHDNFDKIPEKVKVILCGTVNGLIKLDDLSLYREVNKHEIVRVARRRNEVINMRLPIYNEKMEQFFITQFKKHMK